MKEFRFYMGLGFRVYLEDLGASSFFAFRVLGFGW